MNYWRRYKFSASASHRVNVHILSEIMGWPEYPLGKVFYHISLMGYYPILWKGRFPEGYCIAYRPPEHPWPDLPLRCIPTHAQLKAGAWKPTHPKPIGLSIPDVPVVESTQWQALARATSPVEALRTWLASWCETPACAEVLDLLCRRVDGMAINRKRLCVHAKNSFDQGVTVRFAGPWTKELAPMPRSAAALIRRHNGIKLGEDGRDDEEDLVFPWNGKRFTLPEWQHTWTPDPMDPDEPFMKPPMAPLYADSHNIWVFHPHRARGADELELRRVCGPGELGRPLPFGLPAATLRLLAYRLVPDQQALGQQFGLGFLGTGADLPNDRFGLQSDHG